MREWENKDIDNCARMIHFDAVDFSECRSKECDVSFRDAEGVVTSLQERERERER